MLPSFGKGTHDACAIAAFFRSMLCLHHTPIIAAKTEQLDLQE
jgi:hypothetical protein